MKKSIIFLVGAFVLLLTGCSKEMNPKTVVNGEEVIVSFTTEVPGTAKGKATIDGDGAGANVDQCRLQIWLGDILFYDETKSVSDLKAKFEGIKLVKDQTYDFLFWADNAAGAYYTTDDLHSVTLAKDYAGNDDARDAFAQAIAQRTVTAAFSETVKLYRPFAQLNVITTDIDELWAQLPTVSQTLDNLKKVVPQTVKVEYTAANKYNVLTAEVSGSQAFSWTGNIYSQLTSTTDLEKKTLSMDYIFAPTTESNVIDIKYVANNTTPGAASINCTFTNIPIVRNYRTNIIGDLLTYTSTFNVVIEPTWTGEKNPTI